MKSSIFFFNILSAGLLLSCRPAMTVMTPSVEMNQAKAEFPKSDSLLSKILRRYPQYFDTLLQHKNRWRMQIIYTQIDRNANNKPSFTNYYYNVDPNSYYYPASTVKLPTALLALQHVNELKIKGLDKNTTMITEAASEGQTKVYNDPTSADGRPSIAHYLKKILLVSDNDAFNRLYEFLGQEYINNSLHKMGYDSVQILHRLQLPLSEEQNRHTNPVRFYDAQNRLVYEKPATRSNLVYLPRQNFLGNGYMMGEQLVNNPFDFSKKNRLNLPDLHSILTSLIFPESVPKKQRFNLTPDDYQLVYKYMSMKPQESHYPSYDSSYPDAYAKLLLFGSKGKIEDPSLRIFNKEGDAYGFLTDAAYIVNFDKGIEFLLSATIYCNSDEIFNDDKYDYETVGYPFLKNLGKVMYDYEAARPRKSRPDLSSLRFDYSQ